jgi:glutamate synthase domain-containing protein 2
MEPEKAQTTQLINRRIIIKDVDVSSTFMDCSVWCGMMWIEEIKSHLNRNHQKKVDKPRKYLREIS